MGIQLALVVSFIIIDALLVFLVSSPEVNWTIPFTAVATSCTAVLAQFFHAYRYYRLTKSIPIATVLCLLSLLGFIFGVYAGVDLGVINQ